MSRFPIHVGHPQPGFDGYAQGIVLCDMIELRSALRLQRIPADVVASITGAEEQHLLPATFLKDFYVPSEKRWQRQGSTLLGLFIQEAQRHRSPLLLVQVDTRHPQLPGFMIRSWFMKRGFVNLSPLTEEMPLLALSIAMQNQ